MSLRNMFLASHPSPSWSLECQGLHRHINNQNKCPTTQVMIVARHGVEPDTALQIALDNTQCTLISPVITCIDQNTGDPSPQVCTMYIICLHGTRMIRKLGESGHCRGTYIRIVINADFVETSGMISSFLQGLAIFGDATYSLMALPKTQTKQIYCPTVGQWSERTMRSSKLR